MNRKIGGLTWSVASGEKKYTQATGKGTAVLQRVTSNSMNTYTYV